MEFIQYRFHFDLNGSKSTLNQSLQFNKPRHFNYEKKSWESNRIEKKIKQIERNS